MDTTQPLSSAIAVSSGGPMHKLANEAGMEFMCGTSNENCPPRLTWLCHHCVHNLPAAQSSPESPLWNHFLGRPARYLVASCLHSITTSIMEGAAFYPYWNKQSGCGLLFLHAMFLTKPPPMVLQNAFFTFLLFHRAWLLIRKLTAQHEERGNGPRLMEFTGLPMFPTILKQLA